MTLDNSVMPALETICSLMQPLCPKQGCPSPAAATLSPPHAQAGWSKCPPAQGALASASTPQSVPDALKLQPCSTVANMTWQASLGTVPAQLTASHLCLPPFIKPHKGMEQWGVYPHMRHTGQTSPVLYLGSFLHYIGELIQSTLQFL